jgi:hypothetical protein
MSVSNLEERQLAALIKELEAANSNIVVYLYCFNLLVFLQWYDVCCVLPVVIFALSFHAIAQDEIEKPACTIPIVFKACKN